MAGARSQLVRLGLTSWAVVGIVVLAAIVAAAVGALSGILIPLIIAVIIGTVLEPVTDRLRRWRVPRTLAVLISLLLVAAVAAGVVAIVVWGFIGQLPEISRQLLGGWTYLLEWVRSLDIDTVLLEQARRTLYGYAPQLGQGALGLVSSTFVGAVSLGIGIFFALFFLFFVLRDHDRFPRWIARVARLDEAMVVEVDELTRTSLQGYFRGISVTALITAPIFMVPLLLLGVPLAVPIFILYFFLSFIPYIGAWITGAFAILIAFGSVGPTAALIVALSLLVSNGTIQSAVSSWALGSSLKMHPVAVLLATIVGGTIGGILGMVLGPPLLAAANRSVGAVRARLAVPQTQRGPDGGSAGAWTQTT